MRRIIRVFWILPALIVFSAIPYTSPLAQREISPEATVFQRLRDGIVTVFGDAGHGSGFLVDQKGLFVTNQHVVAKSSHIKIQINDSVCVKAALLLEDEKADIAVLRVHPYRVIELPVLPLRHDSLDLVYEGEKVLAIGNPLSQTRMLTVGVVSKVHEGAIISDVDLNPGSSGGPLINIEGEVVGITTFSERSAEGGEGISGIIAIPNAYALIDSALSIADSRELPSPELLPVLPKEMFPLRALEEMAKQKKVDKRAYALSRGGFNVQLLSPSYAYWIETQNERRMAEARQKREERGKVAEKDKYNPNDKLKDWIQYLGEYPPVVVITVLPKIGETAGSFFGNLLGAAITGAVGGYYYHGYHTMEFQADLKDFAMMSEGEEIQEIRRGVDFVSMNFFESGFGGSYGGTDMAQAGLFMFSPEVFAPDSTGWPRIKLYMWSIDRPDRPDTLTIPQRTCERLWLDFEPYREEQKWSKMAQEELQ